MAVTIIGGVVALALGAVGGFFLARFLANKSADQNKASAGNIIKNAMADAATAKKEAMLEIKEEQHKARTQIENELRERRAEAQKIESRILSREEQLAKREELLTNKEFSIDNVRADVENTKKQVERNLADAKGKVAEAVAKLETITGLTKTQAKKELVDSLLDEAKGEAAEMVRRIELDAQEDADKKAREVITAAVQRCAADHASEITISTIPITSDEVKGRLIGREGRNIRAIEAATGVDLIIDDTPEAITISSFDPYRREIARVAIEKLIMDGRIHPARIEEIVERTRKEIDGHIKEYGETAAYDCKVHGLHPELIKQLGRLKYRTSYGQNVLNHSKEVSMLAGLLAVELGANEQIAKRGGLLHDLGKATDHEVDGTHVSIGVELAKKCKESPEVIHCIEAHHGDVPYKSIEAIIVQVADAISSARPGARRENLENYVKRLRELEEIADKRPGVEKSFALSAGREIRIIVKPDQVSDEQSLFLAKDIAKEIEDKLNYPGQIKVNVIRESRATEYAK
jgi:ribonuclease Y